MLGLWLCLRWEKWGPYWGEFLNCPCGQKLGRLYLECLLSSTIVGGQKKSKFDPHWMTPGGPKGYWVKNVVILSEKREFSRLVTKIFFSPLRLIMWFNSQLKQTRTNVDHLYGHVTNPKWIQTSYGFSLKISDPVLENRTIGQFFSILAGFVL